MPFLRMLPNPTEAATRRDVLRGIGALTLAGLLAACGVGPEADDAGSATARTVEHAFGTTEVPPSADRVADINGNEVFHLLGLGVAPAAVPDWMAGYGDQPEDLSQALGDAIGLGAGASTPVDLEEVAAAEPDVILAQDGTVDEIYDELSGIAPTVVVTFADDWRDSTRLVGAAIGAEDRAEEQIAEVEAQIAALAEAWGEQLAGRSYTLMAPFPPTASTTSTA